MKKSIATALSLLALVGLVGCTVVDETTQGTDTDTPISEVVGVSEEKAISTTPLGKVQENYTEAEYYEHVFKLSDGREVTCISGSSGSYSDKGIGASLSCDWQSATAPEEVK